MRAFASLLALALLVAGPARAQIFDSGPAVEVMPASAPVRGTVLFLSGDRGWRRSRAREVMGPVRQAGFTVVGLDSLAFFDRARTPAELAGWIAAAARAAPAGPLFLVGQSFGADAIPAALPLLPPPLLQRVAGIGLIVPGTTRLWQVSLAEKLGLVDGEPSVEAGRAAAARFPLLCLRGADEKTSLCPLLSEKTSKRLTRVTLSGGHYLFGETPAMGAALLAWLQNP
jgi:type IV secretory pathway VirJ component